MKVNATQKAGPTEARLGEIFVDLSAIACNVAALRRHVSQLSAASNADVAPLPSSSIPTGFSKKDVARKPAAMMAVVKANAYGHGMLPVARAALKGGAQWIGCATVVEAITLRKAGIDEVPILAWLLPRRSGYGGVADEVSACDTDGDSVETRLVALLQEAISLQIDLGAGSTGAINDIRAAAAASGVCARVHLEADTGMAREGAPAPGPAWCELLEAAKHGETAGDIKIVGMFSHLACADSPEHAANDAQEAAFRKAISEACAHGIEPEIVHLSNSAATLTRPSAHFDLVRCGIAIYGLNPLAANVDVSIPQPVLRRAMTVRSHLALVKRAVAGTAVSYGHTYVADSDTILGIVPIGYADGIPRHASSRCDVLVKCGCSGVEELGRIAGRVCMDQFVIDLGPNSQAVEGDEVIIFGGAGTAPTADDWARDCETINYEIVTRIDGSRRLNRRYTAMPHQEIFD